MSEPGIRVLIADDHRTFAEALRTVIDLERGMAVMQVVSDGREAVEVAVDRHPDVVLLDVEMPGIDGISAAREIRRRDPETRIVILSAHEDENLVARAVEAGVSGYLSKLRPVEQVASAIRAVHQGEPLIRPDEVRRVLARLEARRDRDDESRARVERLTPRQVEILQLMADGRTPEEISERLHISRHTLRTHVQNILTKLKVHSKLQALAEAIRHGRVVARREAE